MYTNPDGVKLDEHYNSSIAQLLVAVRWNDMRKNICVTVLRKL